MTLLCHKLNTRIEDIYVDNWTKNGPIKRLLSVRYTDIDFGKKGLSLHQEDNAKWRGGR